VLCIPAKICFSIKVYNSVTWLAGTSQLVHPKAFIPLCSPQVEVKLYGPKFTTLQIIHLNIPNMEGFGRILGFGI